MKTINNNTTVLFSSILCLFLVWAGCKEEGRIDQIDESAPAPQPVTVTKVENIPGGAIIRYTLPSDENLLGVKAEYERIPGHTVKTEASLYTDSLVIEGLGDTKPHEVRLYSVGRNGKTSDAIFIEATPLDPPIMIATKKMSATFGGVKVELTNEARANLALVLMTDTLDTGEWIPLQTFYTKAPEGSFYRRGLENKEQKFAVYIRDRWNHKSDTLVQMLTPVAEEEIPKNQFQNIKLPGDSWEYIQSAQYAIEGMWDGITSNRSGNVYAGRTTEPMPQHFTISLGHTVSISRFKVHHRLGNEYIEQSPRTFELWGSELPPTDGSWDNWYLLGEFEAFKPSGYNEDGSVGTITAEDKNYAQVEGIDCELIVTDKVEDPHRPVKYIRFRTTSTYSTYGTDVTNGQIIIAEITFWGQIHD